MTGLPDVAQVDPLTELLVQTGQGDRLAFGQVYQLSASRLFPIALRLLRQREAAEEVLQEGFVLIWRKAAQYQPDRGAPLAWMARIVRNCAIDHLRAKNREPRCVSAWDDEGSNGQDPALVGDSLSDLPDESLRSCLTKLQENQRKSILLAYFYGMTHEELAARLDSPLGTVKSWVRRGLLQLRDCLER